MVIVRLRGGLGNQMFQYAAARRLAHVLNAELKLDLNWFKEPDRRPYGLGAFNIAEKMASPRLIRNLTIRRPAFLRMALTRFLGIEFQRPKSYVREKNSNFDSSILTLLDGVYLDGFWQSEKYFVDIEPVIRADLTLREPPGERVKTLAETIASCDSVSIHIRRGDYLVEEKNVFHGLCGLDYYDRCVEIILQRVSNPHFFVFSDDYPWAFGNLKLSHKTTFMNPARENWAFEDLWLMSVCKHHIIANSSFSWWGAWLSNHPNKIVVAPRQWFKTSTLETKDIVPEKWVKI